MPNREYFSNDNGTSIDQVRNLPVLCNAMPNASKHPAMMMEETIKDSRRNYPTSQVETPPHPSLGRSDSSIPTNIS
jgi:hypothetical protein